MNHEQTAQVSEHMSDAVARNLTPEEAELQRKRCELAALQAELAERELELLNLQVELRAFETTYLRIVGVRYAELDELEAQIAEELAQREPGDTDAQERAARRRAQADQSARSVGESRGAGKHDGTGTPKASDELKRLYREVVKALHPDLAANDEQRTLRSRLMAAANQAYAEDDETKLREVLQEWQASPQSVVGEGAGADLVRVIRQIAHVRARLEGIENEIAALRDSELFQLRIEVDDAERQGRDLLAEMAKDLDRKIARAEERLRSVRATRTEC